MNRNLRPSEAGFTLLEALISLFIFLLVLTGVMSVFVPSYKIYTRAERRADAQDNARLAMTEMSRQIRLAGYFPENFGSPPASPLLATPLRVATDTAVAFYGDADGAGASNVFLYCRDGNLLRRNRGLSTSATSYTCNSGEILAENVTALRFTYYEADGDPVPSPPTTPYTLDSQGVGAVPSLATTTQRVSVRRILITLTARRDLPGGGVQDYTLISNVWLRNPNS